MYSGTLPPLVMETLRTSGGGLWSRKGSQLAALERQLESGQSTPQPQGASPAEQMPSPQLPWMQE
jgi:hypothetical protein